MDCNRHKFQGRNARQREKVENRAQVLPGDVITLGSTSLMLKRTSEAKNLKVPKRRRVHAASPLDCCLP